MMMGVNERRIKWRDVWAPFVICPFEGTRSRVESEGAEQRDDGEQPEPPRILPLCGAEMALCTCGRTCCHEGHQPVVLRVNRRTAFPQVKNILIKRSDHALRLQPEPAEATAGTGRSPVTTYSLHFDYLQERAKRYGPSRRAQLEERGEKC